MIKFLSVSVVIVGILYVIVAIVEYNKTCREKYNKIKLFMDIATGFSYTIIGILVTLNVITGKYLGFIVILFAILNGVVNYKIKSQSNI